MKVNLDRRVTIQRLVAGQDPVFGSPTAVWVTVAVVWAELQDVLPSRSEAVRQGLVNAAQQTRARLRYRDDVTSAMRILDGARALQIVGGPAQLGRKEYIEMLCETYATEGGG